MEIKKIETNTMAITGTDDEICEILIAINALYKVSMENIRNQPSVSDPVAWNELYLRESRRSIEAKVLLNEYQKLKSTQHAKQPAN